MESTGESSVSLMMMQDAQPTGPSVVFSLQYSASHKTMRPSSRAIPPHMESAVTKLLVAARQLLESLQMWSTMRMTDLEVRLDSSACDGGTDAEGA